MENTDNFQGPHIRESDLDWLLKVCRESKKTLLIFSHIPLSGSSQIGNVFFENNQALSKYTCSGEIRSILKQAKNNDIDEIKAEFIPTEKNQPAENFLANYGFKKQDKFWIYKLNNDIKSPNHLKVEIES